MKTMELFAGVGGFRVGLENADPDYFETIWANQFEPGKKAQDAFDCYNSHFPDSTNVNEDISKVPTEVFEEMDIDLIVGGFPCQDYSVARTKSNEQGIQGKKGVLFWEIRRIVEATSPQYILLENVDRLLKCPSKQRGRDFSIMLATFRDLGYFVEWRVINAADYECAQKRRRVFIFAYRKDTAFKDSQYISTGKEILTKDGFFAPSFPVKDTFTKNREHAVVLPEDIVDISDHFSFDYHKAGVMMEGVVYTADVEVLESNPVPLRDILVDEDIVPDEYYLTPEQIEKFNYLRGPKKIERTSKDGHTYIFSEGGMSEIDVLTGPGRTMLTSEGTVNRSTHVVEVNGRRRFLMPIECERLNGFPDDWTEEMSKRMRYFCMGNALVTNLITIMGNRIMSIV